MALQKQLFNIPISGGVDTKTDPFQVTAPNAALLENARFQKTGKLSKRFGLVALTTSSNDGFFASSSVESIVCDEDYLSTITDKGVYAYSQGDNEWYKQASFTLSSRIKSDYISKNQFNQRRPDFDITSDGSHRLYTCVQNSQTELGPTYTSSVLSVLEDTATGLKKSATIDLSITTKGRGSRCIVVESSGALYAHVFYFDGNEVKRTVYDENMSPISSGVTIIASSGVAAQFDLCKDSSSIYLAHLTGTTLEMRVYDFTGTQTATRSTTVANALLTVSTYGRGLSLVATSSNIHLAWCVLSNIAIRGFNKDLTDAIAQALTLSGDRQKVSLCSNGSGLTLVYDNETPSSQTGFLQTIPVTFTTTYTFGTELFLQRLNMASQPFLVNSKVFVIVKTNETENKNYYLYNITDSYIVQRFSPGLASSQSIDGSTVDAMVSKTIVVDNVAYTNICRLSILTGSDLIDQVASMSINSHDFSQSSSTGGKFKVGKSLYHVSGNVLEFDKLASFENGFVFTPKIQSVTVQTGVANPNIASKNFSYVAVYEFYNAQGERVLSAPSPIFNVPTTSASASRIDIAVSSLVLSLKSKLGSNNFDTTVGVAIYRTASGGTTFYRVGSSLMTFNNGNSEVINDTAADSAILDNEQLYTTSDVLQNDPAPSSEFAVAGGNRLFLGGLEERDEVAYSKKQLFGEALLFSDFFRIRVSSGTNADKTPISALGYMDGKAIIFRQQSIYFIQGDGPNELGVGSFTDPEIIQSDVGCVDARSVLSMPSGLMFKSRKGIYLLDRGLAVSYIGAQVEDYNDENIVASVLSDKFNECRFYTDQGNCLVYNYLFGTWSVFTDQTSIDADNWQSSPVSIIGNTVFKETENTYLDNGVTGFYPMKYVSPWLKLDMIQGFIRVYRLWILGNNKSTHTLKCKIYTDYDESTSDDYDLDLDVTDQPQYQFNIHLPNQKCQAVKFEIFDDNHAANSNGEAYDLSNIQLEIGFKAGGYKLASTKTY